MTEPPLSFPIERASLRDVLQVIQDGSVSAAFAVHDDGRLAGILTDGDVRRALLDGASLDDPAGAHVVASPLVVGVRESRAVALDIMRARVVSQVPIVDDDGMLVGVHTLHGLVGDGPERSTVAVILAGGRGTRLRPITEEIPKPMVTVAGRPLLERLVFHLAGFGVTDIVLAVGYRSDMIRSHFGDGSGFGCRIRYVDEGTALALGTCGPLALLEDAIGPVASPLLVLNGDLLTSLDVASLLDDHERRGAMLTIATREVPFRVPYAVVDHAQGRVRAIEEKPVLPQEVSLGIYVLDPACLGRIPRGVPYDMPHLVDDLLREGLPVRAWRSDEDWSDIGTPGDLDAARGNG